MTTFSADNEQQDEAFLAELRALGPFDPVPAEVMAAARSSFAWRTMDAELAELTYDSSLESRELAGVRGEATTARMLTFESPALTVEVEAVSSGGRSRLIGQLVPPQPGEIEVRHGGTTVTVEADELGRFSADDLVPGPVSLRCRGAGLSSEVTTDWILV